MLAEANPKLAREWHPTKNAPLTPKDVFPNSDRKVWWLCRYGHEWEAALYNRNYGGGCPYCAGKKACADNCLQTVKPEVARQWHPARNAPLTPKNVMPGTQRKAWWLCEKGHVWQDTIAHRSGGRGCPDCSGRRLSKENCLQTLNPKLARQWHPTKNAPLTPKDVTAGSIAKVWWLCKQGHAWEVRVADRKRGEGCPYCAGRKASRENCLQTLNPKVARQWHPTKNGSLTPRDVTAGSARSVWWFCGKGHSWDAKVADRKRGLGCPYCAGKRTDESNCLLTLKPALARQWHPTKNAPLTAGDVTLNSGKKVWWQCGKEHEWQAQISNRSKGLGCPYCAGQKATRETCLQALNPAVARQWHPTKNAPLTPWDVRPGSNIKAWWVCQKKHEWKATIHYRNVGVGCPYCSGRRATKETCLNTVNSQLARQWHPTKNRPLTPWDVKQGSGKKAWWVCGKGHEWKATILSRSQGNGCPYCSGHKPTEETCLQAVNPILARQWHPAKNAPLTPKDVLPRTNKKVWWLCRKGHEWMATIYDRSDGGGCPFCSGRRPTWENSLESKGRWLAREWHPTKNTSWKPKDVAPYSQRQVWWKCKNGHESRESVCSRYQRGGCPVCVLKRKTPRLFERETCGI
jgi:hypothetical protein